MSASIFSPKRKMWTLLLLLNEYGGTMAVGLFLLTIVFLIGYICGK